MLSRLRGLFAGNPESSLQKAVNEAVADMNLDDPATRTGALLYTILSRQFDLIGKREGAFPYVAPFATDKARGALLGTAIAIVRQQYGEGHQQGVLDTTVAAFTLAYGEENGRFYAAQAMRDSADGNEGVNSTSDWAIKDTEAATSEDSPATAAAFYLAVAGMI